MSKIYQIYGRDAHEMTLQLLEAAEAIRLVPEGGSVALKPNLVVAAPPESGATTHAGVLSGCIAYFQAHGVRDISVIEGSWVGDRTMQAMRVAGYDKVCQTYGVPFYDLKQDGVRKVKTAVGPIDVCRRALDAGLLVDLPVLKGHCQTVMTCALKNLKGCLPDREKRHFHAMGLQKPIAALGAALRPRLIVVDSICGDLNFEEGGTPVQTDRMYLCSDPVQADAYGCALMGLDLADVPYIELAEYYGAGEAKWWPSDLVELNKPGDAQAYGTPGRLAERLGEHVHENQACSACYASLMRALYTSNCGRNEELYIGQGWKGQNPDGLGIGNCCKGATEHIAGCPPTAESIARILKQRE